jgi:asparagine synthase (glutamine-hydrolysing)
MCGIAGALWRGDEKRLELLKSVIPVLRNRGPDEAGLYLDSKVGLVHTRLSIIDHAGGKQPFNLGPDEPILVFNGEIFNYRELRKQLEKAGVSFTTNSDTEVLYALLTKYGTKAVQYLNGQFAFCFYDPKTNILILGRDQFGEKPLYFLDDSRFVFASEIKAISVLADQDMTLCPDAMRAMTSFWAPAPNKTVWKGVKAVPPGYILKVESGKISFEKFIVETQTFESLNPSDNEVRTCFSQAVGQRMVSDVPVGLFLSGGLDSSLVGYEVAQRAPSDLRSYSIGFENQEFDESPQQKIISNFLSTNHQTLMINDKQIIDNFEDALYVAESPTPRSGLVPMYLLCKQVRDDSLKVVLTGEGADEIFLGYDLFREIMLKRAIRDGGDLEKVMPILESLNAFMPAQENRGKFLALRYSNYKKLSQHNSLFSSHTERANLGAMARLFFESNDTDHGWESYLTNKYPDFKSLDELERGRLIEIESLLSGHLLCSQGDRVSMGNSVETRPPFLDKNLVAFAKRISPENHYNTKYGEKAILKKAYKGRIPDEILMRQKFPYRAPDSFAFASDYGRDFVMDKLSSAESSVFDINKFREFCGTLLLKQKISPRENHAFMMILSGIFIENMININPFGKGEINGVENSISTMFGEIIHFN